MFQDGWIIRYIGSPVDHSHSWQDDPHRLALPNNPVQKSNAPQAQKVTLQDQRTGNLTVKPISRSKSLPRTESRHQLRLAIMLPHHITPSPYTLKAPFSRIIRSHNTLSSSFHSFFKVLLSFPSQYFFAIGFPVIFRLWWILSPLQSILPNKFTLYPRQSFSLQPTVTRLSLSLAHISMRFPSASAVKSSRSRLQCATRTPIASDQSVTECRRYQLGPFLFHSPLLKKSLLFSLPSLIDMLKLRESSYRPQINQMYSASKRVQLPNPISIHRFDWPLMAIKNWISSIYDIEAHICPSERAYCHAFKAQHFTLYGSCCLSQFIAFFIVQETKLSRVLFFFLFSIGFDIRSPRLKIFLSDDSRFLISP